jgi:hypothetical protein
MKEARKRLAKAYTSTPIVRAIMDGLPGVLGASGDPLAIGLGIATTAVDSALVAHLSNAVERNRIELGERTESRLCQLEDRGQLDEAVLQSPEFQALVFQAALAGAAETDSTKIDLYAAILSGAASRARPPQLNVRSLLATMTVLTAEEVRLARQFYSDFNQSGLAIVDGLPTPAWGPDTGLYLKHLESADLLMPEWARGRPFEGSAGTYYLTDTFHRLMDLVNQTDG